MTRREDIIHLQAELDWRLSGMPNRMDARNDVPFLNRIAKARIK
ncbi:hypothetical protein [Rhizobium sp. LjRoot258]